jgi:glycosyltransferase involved in cell wall biosynthesis
MTEGPVLLYHGTVAHRFGLHVAIEAVGRLRERLPGVRLFIYGRYDPSYRKSLERLVEASGLGGCVSLGGYLPLEKVKEVIGEADIGVVPYLSDPFMNLALSTKTFEYVSMRLPVVASRLDSITSIFTDRSLEYFNPGNATDLADAIMRICRAPALRKDYIDNAAEAYEPISWPVMSKRYLKTINGLISRTDPRNGL